MISNLFRQEWLNPSDEFGIDQSMKFDAYKMKKFFEHGMKDYCRLILDINCDKGNLRGKYMSTLGVSNHVITRSNFKQNLHNA